MNPLRGCTVILAGSNFKLDNLKPDFFTMKYLISHLFRFAMVNKTKIA